MKMTLNHCYFIFYICIFFQIISISEVQSNEINIIVHPSVHENISANDIRNIFLGKKTQWKDNQHIRFVLLTEKKTYRKFLAKFVGKTLYQYRNYWRKKVFTGTGMMPVMFKNISQSIDYVKRTKGAISFIPKSDKITDDIKELIVNP